jgi:pimeloyl-ACP methyl ester carboxylesterase
MDHLSFTFKEATLHYVKSGYGPKVLFAFHGFGQDYKAFSKLMDQPDIPCTLYAFDLFFHGRSKWEKGETPLEKSYWHEIMRDFLQQEKIDRFSLVGFSIGAKFALVTLESFPNMIDEVYLLAPDGIKVNFWYTLATGSRMFRWVFKRMITKPELFNNLVELAHILRLIDRGVMRFAKSQMNTFEKRNRVYFSWVVFSRLRFNLVQLSNHINSHRIRLTIVVGQYDKIITTESMNTLIKKLTRPQLIILETGHHQILSKWISTYRPK